MHARFEPRIALIGVNVVPMAKSLAPARIWRCGKDYYMPRRRTVWDRQRDQELLSQIPSVSPEQVERDLVAIKTKRKPEMSSGGSADSGLASVAANTKAKKRRARCQRNGRDIDLPVSSSAGGARGMASGIFEMPSSE